MLHASWFPATTKVGAVSATLRATSDGALSSSVIVNGEPFSLALVHSALATGGALATGKCGILDENHETVAAARTFTSVSVSQLSPVPYCIQPSRTMEVRSDSTLTTDSGGTIYGPVPQYRGSRFGVPQDGSANRTSRILVKADRNDLEESDQQTIADAFTAQVFATPRYSVVPR